MEERRGRDEGGRGEDEGGEERRDVRTGEGRRDEMRDKERIERRWEEGVGGEGGVYTMSVSEDKVSGEEVGRLKAKDPDQGENGLVSYRLTEGDGLGVFELTTDSQTREAVIKLKKVGGETLRSTGEIERKNG
ncbi:hypothetical protein CRUP_011886 [Coryphaenoides rupestris]|nr:hypothetical protein CRUP_011886 [Coryphaenoides rupestris]